MKLNSDEEQIIIMIKKKGSVNMPISFCFPEMSFSLLGKKEEAIDKIRRNSVRNEALNDFLRSISDFCDRLSSVSSLPLSSI